jgi:hypothetical protein
MYHIGVVRYIFENPELFVETKYLGASSGAGIVAFVLCFENDPGCFDVLNQIVNFVIGLREKNLVLHKQIDVYSKLLFNFMTEERFNKCIKFSDRCHISVTNVTYMIPLNEIKTRFADYKQFMDTLRASACIPIILDDTIRTVDNKFYLDGGFSNNLPVLDKNTLKVSCLNYPFLNSHLYPKKVCDIMHTFIPPDEKYVQDMIKQGYDDICEYMHDRSQKLITAKNDKDLQLHITQLLSDSFFTS